LSNTFTPSRVVITGIGVISGIGSTRDAFWDSLRTGRPGIQPITSADVSNLRFKNGAEVSNYSHTAYFSDKQADFMDRFAQFAVIAAREAVAQSGVPWSDELKENTAIVTGACVGGQASEDACFWDVYRLEKTRVPPLTIPRIMANAGASHISMEFGVTGPAYTVSTACSSASHAIGQAYWMIRNGSVSMAIAGGSEAPFSYGILKAWEAMRVVSSDTCRPFSKDRNGMILGEGAAMFVLEPLETAQARGAVIYGEICGFGMSADACHITQPSSKGAARSMRAAIRDAGWAPDQIDYVNAHGTATLANDVTEAAAINEVFGSHRPAVSSTKSMHGHALGAGGALEAAATVLGLYEGILPPTANFTIPDPEINLDLIVNEARHVQVERAISNSFAFGGLNAVLAFRATKQK
jgi:nodulation protein E